MSRVAAFLSGAGVAGAIAVFAHSPQVPVDEDVDQWQARARKAERELTMLRTQLESSAARQSTASSTSIPVTTPGPISSPTIPPPPPSPDVEFDPVRHEQWDALVSGALEREVEQRLGQRLSPERTARLLEALRRLRDASAGLRSEFLDPQNPDSLRDHLARTLVLVESDRLFREELGIGFSDFLRGLDGNPVEEVHPAESDGSLR
jgi:hypothetical protein